MHAKINSRDYYDIKRNKQCFQNIYSLGNFPFYGLPLEEKGQKGLWLQKFSVLARTQKTINQTSRNQLQTSVISKGKILLLRNKRHFGAKKIGFYLNLSVSGRTIHRFLTTKGLVAKQPDYRRPLFQNGKSMRPRNTTELGYLQMDTKHVTPELGGLPFTVYEYAAIDILSRYKLAVLLPDISDESASLALEFFLKWFPFPVKYIQTDNGLEFQRSFEKTCLKHNLNHYFIHKNSPNENAVIERSFRTDQDEFYFWLEKTPQHLGELNDWFQQFILLYNTDRPHQSLDYKTPLEAVKYHQSVS